MAPSLEAAQRGCFVRTWPQALSHWRSKTYSNAVLVSVHGKQRLYFDEWQSCMIIVVNIRHSWWFCLECYRDGEVILGKVFIYIFVPPNLMLPPACLVPGHSTAVMRAVPVSCPNTPCWMTLQNVYFSVRVGPNPPVRDCSLSVVISQIEP